MESDRSGIEGTDNFEIILRRRKIRRSQQALIEQASKRFHGSIKATLFELASAVLMNNDQC